MISFLFVYTLTLEHRWQTQGLWAKSSPPPCFYPVAAPSSLPLVKEELHLYRPKITFNPLKVTARLTWSLVKMSLTPAALKSRPVASIDTRKLHSRPSRGGNKQ